MKLLKLRIVAFSILVLVQLACVGVLAAIDDGRPETAAVIPAPESSRLKWENHRLRSANIRLQIENLKTQADSEDKAADSVLDEMQKAVGEKYVPRINQQSGLLEFALKETKPDITTAPTTVPSKKP